MAGAEIDWEIRQRAEELYIYDGLTYEEVAAETGVSHSQLKRWGGPDAGDWYARRKEHRTSLCDIRRYEMEAARKLMEKAAVSGDPKTAYAAQKMAERLLRLTENISRKPVPVPADPETAKKIESPADAVDAIRQAIEKKVNAMLASPKIELADLKTMKDALELWDEMATAHKKETGKTRGITDATMSKIREKILGMNP